ncbi:MAG: alanine--tRNA ligase [Candidatus Bathyarchaeota archaeon]|nr:alanine--tRNA ligase [Candidatus Bathyarchaeota archaeon]
MKKHFSAAEYQVPFFDEQGFVRKLCPSCGEYFWTLAPDMETCGESTSKGCALSTFINNPPTSKAYTLSQMRETFLSFFEKQGHKRLKPYPVVARWRDDLYLTSASIVDFQPYVTNGIIPPPANPLVISQPCIRLVDVDNTGPTFGRHLTFFEMGGHHAFNYPDKEVYWKNDTVIYHHNFVTKQLGIPASEVIYKEDVWIGGGNAGPDLETIVRGLELATLVFMKFKVVNGEFVELPIRTVDTGYGIERFTWISQGAISGFHAIYGDLLDSIIRMSSMEPVDNEVLIEVAKLSGTLSLEKSAGTSRYWTKAAKKLSLSIPALTRILRPMENVFAVVDHSKSLAFMLAEGVVPSNSKEGYLTRLLIRRTYRLLKKLKMENSLGEIIDLQISKWSPDFPHLQEMRDEILKMLAAERKKFDKTLKKGNALVSRIAQELKTKGKRQIPAETLLELYDSHGIPPEAVNDRVRKLGIKASMPRNFYKMIAERHLESREKEKTVSDDKLSLVSDLPETSLLYYEDAYITQFNSQVLRVLDGNKVVLDRTAFYPEGGGQPADKGFLEFNGQKARVQDVQKLGKTIIHRTEPPVPQDGETVRGLIDLDRRNYHMRAHTATHLIMGAARRVLGQHVWQTGTQKSVEQTRLDISHYQRLTLEETNKIEALANQAASDSIPVEIKWLPREEAEEKYGFRLYQGGAVPGKIIRVVKVGEWEVEACAGTHVRNTGEIGYIKILHTERIQDGVERIIYSTGRYAVEASQAKEKLLQKLSATLNSPLDKLLPTTKKLLRESKEARLEKDRLQKALARRGTRAMKPQKISGFNVLSGVIDWISDEQGLVSTSNEFVKKNASNITMVGGLIGNNARIVISLGAQAVAAGISARRLAEEAGSMLGGGGSGTRSFAQAGGPSKDKLPQALEHIQKLVQKHARSAKQ